MDSINIKVFKEPSEAPAYRGSNYKGVDLVTVNVVGNGTDSGRATVDLLLAGRDGQRYMALVKGTYISSIAHVIKAVEDRGENPGSRKAFEQWIGSAPYEASLARYPENSETWPGQYKSSVTQIAWEAWLTAQRQAEEKGHDG